MQIVHRHRLLASGLSASGRARFELHSQYVLHIQAVAASIQVVKSLLLRDPQRSVA